MRPYLPGYDFPLPFGRQLSLLGPSCAHWGLRPSLRLAYSQATLARLRDPIGVAAFHTGRCNWVGRPLYRGDRWCLADPGLWAGPSVRGATASLLGIPYIIVFINHPPMTSDNAASMRVHLRSPVQFFPSPVSP